MHVVLLNQADPKHPKAGGAERLCYELGRRLARDGNEVTWISAQFPGSRREEWIDGIRVTRVGSLSTVHLGVVTKCSELRRADLIVDSMNTIPFFSTVFRRKRVVLLLTHFNDIGTLMRRIGPWAPLGFLLQDVITPLFYRSNRIIAISKSTIDDAIQRGFSDPQLMRLGLDHISRRPGPRTNLVVSPGPIRQSKHQDDVIRAFSRLDDSWRLVLYGYVESPEYANLLVELVRELDIGSRVSFAGYLTEAQKTALLESAKVAVVASEVEGYGISAAEAEWCGCPVVAYDVKGIRDSVLNGETGVLVARGCVDELGMALSTVCNDELLRARLAEAAEKRMSRQTWEATYAQFLQISSRQMNGHHHP